MKHLFIIFILFFSFHMSFARMIRINANGGADFTVIQTGIDNALNADTVLVYPAVYFESIDFKGKEITVASLFLTTGDTSYISNTTLNGNHERNRLVKFISGETRNSKLIGFTITNAFSDKSAATVQVCGLGIYIENSSPTIDHNHIVNNEFGEWYIAGGGIVMINSGAEISNNKISHNEYAYQGGGIYCVDGNGQIIENNEISHHYLNSGYGEALGGGLYILNTKNSLIENNLFEDNYLDFGFGSAIYADGCDSIIFRKNICRNNRSWGGDVEFIYTSGSIINTLIYNINYPNRTLLRSEFSELKITNSTIVNSNTTSVTMISSVVQFTNTILFGVNNTPNMKYINLFNTEAHFINCNIEGDTAGINVSGTSFYTHQNIISSNPIYNGNTKNPYSLTDNSPCINAGSPDTTNLCLPPTDLAGLDRIIKDTIDIGAYEYQVVNSLPKYEKCDKIEIYPNPANTNVVIENLEKSNVVIKLKLFSMSGKLLLEKEFTGKLVIETEKYPSGVYLAEIIKGNKISTRKIIIQQIN